MYASLVVMGVVAVTCPRCDVRYDLPDSGQPGRGPHGPARSHISADGVVSIRVNDAVVHQCQPGIDLGTGQKAWRPARTVGEHP